MPEPMSPTAAAPKSAPFGASPASGPTPNQGYEAQALQQLGVVVKQLEQLVPMVGASSELGAAVLKMLPQLAKFTPPGAVTPAGERNVLEGAMLQNARQGPLLAQIRQSMAGGPGGPGGAPGGAPGGMAGGGGPPSAAPQPRMM
jgi:hypothetical protein